MADAPQTITRSDLYAKLWSTSLTRTAKELGVSVTRLTKLCEEYRIPRPVQGHWKRLELGLPTTDISLPEVLDPDLQEVLLFREGFEPKTKQKPVSAILVVPETLTEPHKLITATQRHLQRAKAAENGKIYSNTNGCLDVSVTTAALDRTLRIYDTVIKHWESIGGSVQIGVQTHNEKRVTVFKLKDGSAAVAVIEVVHRKELPRKPARELYGYSPQEFTYHPTGKLQFEIDGPYGSKCCDGKKQNLEANPLKIVNSIRDVFERRRIAELDRACRERQDLQLDQIHNESKKRKEREEARRESLLKDFVNWKKATEIRQYLAALRARIDSGLHLAKDEQHSESWFEWAEWYADVCDPLVTPAERQEYVRCRTNVPVESLDVTHDVRQALLKLGVKDCNDLAAVSLPQYKLVHGHGANSGWRELARVLVIHGYDVSQREEVSYWS